MDGEGMQLINRAWLTYRDEHGILTGVPKSKDKQIDTIVLK